MQFAQRGPKMKRLLLTTAITIFTTTSSFADTMALVNQWYGAIKTSNRAVFKEMIAEDASIEIRPLEITQTKSEFIEALDTWEEITDDLTLIIKGSGATGETTAQAMVCYRFSENSYLNEETFTFLDGKITAHTQTRREDEC